MVKTCHSEAIQTDMKITRRRLKNWANYRVQVNCNTSVQAISLSMQLYCKTLQFVCKPLLKAGIKGRRQVDEIIMVNCGGEYRACANRNEDKTWMYRVSVLMH